MFPLPYSAVIRLNMSKAILAELRDDRLDPDDAILRLVDDVGFTFDDAYSTVESAMLGANAHTPSPA
jgi:hypothetical protein